MNDHCTSAPIAERKGNVFVVDDEKDMLLLYEDILKESYTVESATTGPKALQKIDESTDVVLLDRTMPEMTGDEVLGILREEGIGVQVAMVTAIKPTEKTMEMPFDGYMTKPIEENEVIGLVETLMARKRYHQASQRFFRHVAKKATLERVGRTNTGEYIELVEQTEELRTRIDRILDGLSTGLGASQDGKPL